MGTRALGRTAFAITFFLGALVLVAWRQSRALEALATLDDVRREASVASAERAELQRQIQVLISRQRVVPEARERLGMDTPEVGVELVLLPGETAQ